jgi:uncharacterized membrane protein (DUF4010 family)
MERFEIHIRLGLALGLGLLIGLQREQAAAAEGTPKGPGGSRTYPICALIGALSALLAGRFGGWILGAALVTILVPLALAYADDLRRDRGRGATSEIAFVATFLIGAFCGTRDLIQPLQTHLFLASASGILVAVLLSAKELLHGLAAKISREDVYATLKFVVLAAVILPVLPNRSFGPLSAFNPFNIGLMIALIAGVSFFGYIAMRILGVGRGVGVTGILGGLASSTAVTLSFCARARETPAAAGALAPAVVLACSIMFPRVLVELAVVHWDLMLVLIVPVCIVTALGMAAGAILLLQHRRNPAHAEELRLTNPFKLASAIKFGLIFALVLFAAKAGTHYFGAEGGYVASVLAGTTDVDAVTLSMARLAREGLDPRIAATSILLACATNTLVKAGMTFFLGRLAFGLRAGVPLGVMAAGAAAAIASLWLFPL